MLISHKYKFIFFHNYKVAGSSIREVLSKQSDTSLHSSTLTDNLKFRIGRYPKIFSNDFPKHISPDELMHQISSKIFDRYFKFGFVRNPYDWQVSLYKYMLKEKNHFQHGIISQMKDFNEYISWRCNNEVKLQKDFFYQNNHCLVDYIGKLESLQKDFDFVCKKIGIKKELLPHVNVSNYRDYLSYYNEETLELVNNHFKKDFQTFGYLMINKTK